MDPATASGPRAMKFENRPNPYPFYEELRKTPVAQVGAHLMSSPGTRKLLCAGA